MAKQTIQVTGTNLFELASYYLGDATLAGAIAEANNDMTDWWISGLTTIVIPDPSTVSYQGGLPLLS